MGGGGGGWGRGPGGGGVGGVGGGGGGGGGGSGGCLPALASCNPPYCTARGYGPFIQWHPLGGRRFYVCVCAREVVVAGVARPCPPPPPPMGKSANPLARDEPPLVHPSRALLQTSHDTPLTFLSMSKLNIRERVMEEVMMFNGDSGGPASPFGASASTSPGVDTPHSASRPAPAATSPPAPAPAPAPAASSAGTGGRGGAAAAAAAAAPTAAAPPVAHGTRSGGAHSHRPHGAGGGAGEAAPSAPTDHPDHAGSKCTAF